jgi:uncharacterized protein (DUF2336 family)
VHSTLEKLGCLARDRTPAGRTVLFDRVAGLLLESDEELPAGATALIDQILTGLLHEVEAEVRKKLACRIAMLECAPRDLIRALAADDIEIAEPILVQSPVLSTKDLLDVIEARSPAHREALARRAQMPGEVMAALVRLKEPQVLRSLLSNAGVSIPRNIFNDLVAIAEGMEQIRMPLVAREELFALFDATKRGSLAVDVGTRREHNDGPRALVDAHGAALATAPTMLAGFAVRTLR